MSDDELEAMLLEMHTRMCAVARKAGVSARQADIAFRHLAKIANELDPIETV